MKLLGFIIKSIFISYSFAYCPDGSIPSKNGDCEKAGVILKCSSNGFQVEYNDQTG